MLEYLYFDFRTACGIFFWILFSIYLYSKCERKKPAKISLDRVGWPLLGTFLRCTSDTHLKLDKFKKKRGEVFSVYLGSEKVVVLNSEKAIAEAFTKLGTCDRISDSSSTEHKSDFVAHDLDIYTQHKRFDIINFDLRKEKLEEKIQLEICHFLNLVDGFHGCQLDFDNIVDRSTTNMMCLLVFGKAYAYGGKELMTLIALLNETSNHVKRGDLHLTLPRINPVSSTQRNGTVYEKAKEICKVKIEEHKQTFNAECVEDFVDSNLKEMKNQEKSSFSDDNLVLSTIDLIISGTEALSSCIMWCAYAIATYPEVKAKMLKEVDVLERFKTPSFSDYKSMPYIQAFIHEIIRWKTIIPLSYLKCIAEHTTVCGHDIPKGTTVVANFWAVNHDPEIWDDPNTFKPERFLKPDGGLKLKSNSGSFSLDNRNYPGETMVHMEVFLYIVSILQKFDICFLPEFKSNLEKEFIGLNRPNNFVICMPPRYKYKKESI